MPSKEFEKIPTQELAAIREYLSVKPVPLGKIATALGIEVRVSSLPVEESGVIENESGQFVIKINRNESRERQRFTLAHEIAHYLLHRDQIGSGTAIRDNRLYRSGAPEQVEYEANRLAADLVMPDELLQEDIPRLRSVSFEDALEQLAAEWQVSKAAMEIRVSTIVGR